jgi:hypothetical protein
MSEIARFESISGHLLSWSAHLRFNWKFFWCQIFQKRKTEEEDLKERKMHSFILGVYWSNGHLHVNTHHAMKWSTNTLFHSGRLLEQWVSSCEHTPCNEVAYKYFVSFWVSIGVMGVFMWTHTMQWSGLQILCFILGVYWSNGWLHVNTHHAMKWSTNTLFHSGCLLAQWVSTGAMGVFMWTHTMQWSGLQILCFILCVYWSNGRLHVNTHHAMKWSTNTLFHPGCLILGVYWSNGCLHVNTHHAMKWSTNTLFHSGCLLEQWVSTGAMGVFMWTHTMQWSGLQILMFHSGCLLEQ